MDDQVQDEVLKKGAKRPDVVEKKKAKKENDQVVVKVSLRKYLVGDGATKDRVVQAIKARVEEISKRTVLASRALSGLLKQVFEANDEIPNIFDTTFVRQLMLGTESAHEPYDIITRYFQDNPRLLHNGKRLQADSNIYVHASLKYITNLKNSLKMNFPKRVKKYLGWLEDCQAITQPEKVYVLYSIMGWKPLPKDIVALKIHKRRHIVSIVKQQRDLLGLKIGQEVTDAWFKKENSLKGILKQWTYFNKLGNGFKTFDIVPISKMRHHFATIDNESFLGMLVELEIIKNANADASMLWPTILKTKSFETRKNLKRFTGTISTDGISVCMHHMRPKPKKLTTDQKQENNDKHLTMFHDRAVRKLACDPGRQNIYSIVEELENGKIKQYSLTRQQYYNESGMTKATKQTIQWSKKIQDNLVAMSQVTTKGVDVKKHQEYLEAFYANFDDLWTEYTNKHWADQRMRLYGGKKRTMARFWNRVLGKEKERTQPTVIAYGAAKFAPGGKGEVSVPTTSAFQACSSQVGLVTVFVDEFRTTKICYKTDRLLQTVKVYKKDKTPLRGLLWCDSTSKDSEQGAFVNRDVNAAMNILRCVTLPQRPAILNRKLATAKLPKQQVGKVLRNLRIV
jgi:hypothetical protein